MPTVTVSTEGQVLIPAEVLAKLGITPGSEVEVTTIGNRVEIVRKGAQRVTTHEEGFGMLRYRGEPHRLSEFDVAEAMAAADACRDRG